MKKLYTIFTLILAFASCVPPGKLNDALEANTKLEIKYDSFYQSHKDTVAVIANSISNLKVTVKGLSDSVNFYREIAMRPVELTKGDILFNKIVKAGVLSESDLGKIDLTERNGNLEGSKFLTALKNDVKTITGAESDLKMGKGFIYVDVSTKLLFNSGKNTLTSKANLTLIQIAKLLNNNPDVEVLIEGHTDNKSFKSSAKTDNWDLSVQRATSVVRILQTKYKVNPSRIIAAGRGEFMPIDNNNTAAGRANNRYLRIVLIPTLGQVLSN